MGTFRNFQKAQPKPLHIQPGRIRVYVDLSEFKLPAFHVCIYISRLQKQSYWIREFLNSDFSLILLQFFDL